MTQQKLPLPLYGSVEECATFVDALQAFVHEHQGLGPRRAHPACLAPEIDPEITPQRDEKLDNTRSSVAMLFSCHRFSSRTMLAMAAAVLVLLHRKGYPYIGKPVDYQADSHPDYAKGLFPTMQHLVDSVGDGGPPL